MYPTAPWFEQTLFNQDIYAVIKMNNSKIYCRLTERNMLGERNGTVSSDYSTAVLHKLIFHTYLYIPKTIAYLQIIAAS